MRSPSVSRLRRRSVVVQDDSVRVLGIDASLTSTGYAYRDSAGGVITGRVTCGELKGQARLFYIRMQIMKVVQALQPTLVVYENYAMSRGGKSAPGRVFNIGELGGVLRLALWEAGFDVLYVAPTMMKSVIAENGKAEKPEVRAALNKRFSVHVVQNDEADAAGLMIVGEIKCGVGRIYPKVGKSDRSKAVRELEIDRGKLQSISKSRLAEVA